MRRVIPLMLFVVLAPIRADPASSTQPASLGDRIGDRLGLPSSGDSLVPAGDIVTLTSRATPNKTPSGGTVQLDIVAKIAQGWHINSHRPTLDFLVPTRLSLTLPAGVKLRTMDYPAPVRKKFALSDEALDLYEGDAVFKATLTVASSVPPGDLSVRGRLDYQSCNDAACLPPATKEFQITFQVAGGPARGSARDTEEVTMTRDSAAAPPDRVVAAPETGIAPAEDRVSTEEKWPWLYTVAGIVLAGALIMMLKRRK